VIAGAAYGTAADIEGALLAAAGPSVAADSGSMGERSAAQRRLLRGSSQEVHEVCD
jgi:hypothetical protein